MPPSSEQLFYQPTVSVLQRPGLDPWIGLFVDTGPFPMAKEPLAWLKLAVAALLEDRPPADELAVCLEVNAMPIRSSSEILRSNAALWLPVTGLGIYPDRPTPRLWTEDDFLDREYGEKLPLLMNSVVVLEGGQEAALDAIPALLGSGSLSFLGASGAAEALLDELTEQYGATITEPALTGMPFYVPLLSLAMLPGATADAMRDWLGSADLYLRELPEDKGVLLLARTEQARRVMSRLVPPAEGRPGPTDPPAAGALPRLGAPPSKY